MMDMIGMSITIHQLDDPPLWGGTDVKVPVIDAGTMAHVAILDKGMASGRPSVMFRTDLPDGTMVVSQQSARQMVLLGRMIMAKYPDLMDGDE